MMSMSTDSSRRLSNRVTKCKNDFATNNENGKKVRSCGKTGCHESEPSCCLVSCESCTMSGYTSRWYHMSLGEHFCNNCFDNYYRPGKSGNKHFNEWTNKWSFAARATKPSIKCFIANELLPYWLKCSSCGKWRMIRKSEKLDSQFIRNFKCSSDKVGKHSCEIDEDENVSLVWDHSFFNQLAEQPLLKYSPAGPYLKRFLPEDVGICPIDGADSSYKSLDNIELFNPSQSGESVIWVKPDTMDEDETELANRYFLERAIYLSLRNLIVSLWNLTPSQWLTVDKVNEHLFCRGLVRIYLHTVVKDILELLISKAVINYGIIKNPDLSKLKNTFNKKVLVIGAGTAGLAAASHLQNLGINVTVYEATSHLGGRVKDHPTTGLGAFFIEGPINNPFITLSMQAGVFYHSAENNVVVLTQNGKVIPDATITMLKDKISNLFCGAVEWAFVKKEDKACQEFIIDGLNKLREQTQFCNDPDSFNQLLSLVGIELKANLDDLSLQNFEYVTPLVGGTPVVLNGGLSQILNKLGENISILYNKEVKEIDYTNQLIKVITSDGKEATFNKVLVTIPISVLRQNIVKFVPPLPESKLKALNSLADYYVEKLILEFPERFWTKFHKGPFCIISTETIFEMFYDITANKKSIPTLMCFIQQKSISKIANLPDKEVVNMCLTFLKSVFPCKVPQPKNWYVSHWCNEQHSGSFGSYIKVGCQQSAYDYLAEAIDDKVYFAGEATIKNIPSTVTGAYLSGLREAANIINQFEM